SVEQERGHTASRLHRPTERDRVKMHTLEVTGRLMLLGIADRPQCLLRFERNPPQCVTPESNGGIDEIAPIPVPAIVQMRGMVERQAHTFECDQAVRKL